MSKPWNDVFRFLDTMASVVEEESEEESEEDGYEDEEFRMWCSAFVCFNSLTFF